MSEPDCIFCQIAAGELPAQIVAEDDRTITFMDIFPGTRGHALVIPRRHARDLLEVESGEAVYPVQLAELLAEANAVADDADEKPPPREAQPIR